MAGVCIVVSGLPASGKSTLGRAVAGKLGFAYIDKDDILEALFDALGCNSPARRTELSRASDHVLREVAKTAGDVVLVSFWNTPSAGDGGTSADWIDETFERVIELHCSCLPEVAARRFIARQRHPGHFDAHRDAAGLTRSFRELGRDGPLGIGTLVYVDTTDARELAGAVSQRLAHLARNDD